MIFEIYVGATIAITAGRFIYHRWIEDKPRKPRPADIELPRVEQGTPLPLVYGRCRVRAPVVVWTGNYRSPNEDSSVYSLDVLFVVGTPFYTGRAELMFNGLWYGDIRIGTGVATSTDDPGGIGNVFDFVSSQSPEFYDFFASGHFFAASPIQVASAALRNRMVTGGVADSLIPGYRRQILCAMLGNNTETSGMKIGTSPEVRSVNFEIRALSTGSASFLGQTLADDADPAAVIYDLLTGFFGKIGLEGSRVGIISFQNASLTLFNESHGYSRSFEQGDDAANMIADVLRQIDGILYEEPTTGQITIKLVRFDYNVNDLDDINPDNASPAGDGWYSVQGLSETYNAIRLTFTDRDKEYQDGIEVAQNMANVVAQGGRLRSLDLHMPGICTRALAQKVASRELAAVSSPLAKASVLCDRSFYPMRPGDVATFTWPELGIDHMVMRIVAVDLGTRHDGKIRIDMMRDIFDVSLGAFPIPA